MIPAHWSRFAPERNRSAIFRASRVESPGTKVPTSALPPKRPRCEGGAPLLSSAGATPQSVLGRGPFDQLGIDLHWRWRAVVKIGPQKGGTCTPVRLGGRPGGNPRLFPALTMRRARMGPHDREPRVMSPSILHTPSLVVNNSPPSSNCQETQKQVKEPHRFSRDAHWDIQNCKKKGPAKTGRNTQKGQRRRGERAL